MLKKAVFKNEAYQPNIRKDKSSSINVKDKWINKVLHATEDPSSKRLGSRG